MLSHARLHVRTRDAAPAILFVHGGFHGAWCWTNVTEYLAENGLTCAALDLRGHGGLPQDHSFITDGVAAMVSDVREAAALLPRPLFLAGHSLGALIVLQAAAPISPDGLILLSPAAPAGVPRMHKLPRFPTDRAVAPPPQERARKWFMSGSASPLDEYLPRLCPESPTLLNECLHDGIEVALEADRWPALCISGGKDDSPLHPGGQDQAIAAWLGTSVHVISQSGHCLMLDDGWRETAATIQSWVKART